MVYSDKIHLETDIQVKEIMRSNVKTVDYNATVVDAAQKMCSRDIAGSCVVLKNNHPIGIITEQDINCKVVAKSICPNETLVKEVMTEPLITVLPDIRVEQAIKMMNEKRVRRLPVVNAEKKLIGIVTVRDIMALGATINELVHDLGEINRISEERGVCERCGCMSDVLYPIDNLFLCLTCKEDELL
ncbi:MAG: CBS domain-containing protein [Methanomicrobiales archaeon]|nr:CBS domain-containing protein [Methanomicrobiales archaeon]